MKMNKQDIRNIIYEYFNEANERTFNNLVLILKDVTLFVAMKPQIDQMDNLENELLFLEINDNRYVQTFLEEDDIIKFNKEINLIEIPLKELIKEILAQQVKINAIVINPRDLNLTLSYKILLFLNEVNNLL